MLWSDKAHLFLPSRISLLTFVQNTDQPGQGQSAGKVWPRLRCVAQTESDRVWGLTKTAPSAHSLARPEHNAIQNMRRWRKHKIFLMWEDQKMSSNCMKIIKTAMALKWGLRRRWEDCGDVWLGAISDREWEMRRGWRVQESDNFWSQAKDTNLQSRMKTDEM